ncbi:MAG TPA: ATP-binding protein [Polyangiaceae bacterium]|nr:ATP-binding protein [Polyangiaceae bacterium]
MTSPKNVTRPPAVASLSWDDCRLLVESVVDYAIYMLDPEGRVTTWNLGAERMKGYRADEIVGHHFEAFFPEADARDGKPARELAAALAQGRFEEEGWRVRKDGTRFWANVVVTPVRDARGALVGFAKVTRDLSVRREAEEAERKLLQERAARAAAEESERRLRESEARYRALSRRLEIILEGVADGITVQDPSGRVVFANRAAAKICGYDSVEALIEARPPEVVGRFDLWDEQGRPFQIEDLPGRRALRGEEVGSRLMHVRDRASGRDWWSVVRSGAVLGPDGRPELAVTIWHDVTAERRQEEQTKHLADATAALAASLDGDAMLAALARALVPRLADWCSIYLLEGDALRNVAVVHADPAKVEAAREYARRHPPDPARPGGVWQVVRTGRPELHSELPDEPLARGHRGAARLEASRSLGLRSGLIVPIRVRDRVTGAISAESGRRYEWHDVALLEELGRRAGVALENAQLYEAAQRAARAAERAAEAAEEANRIKDEFLATVSHELRTPLNAIVGWASILRQQPSGPGLAKAIEVIDRNARAQVKIVDDILDVSRIVTGKLRLELRPTDLAAVAAEAIEVVRPSAEAKAIAIEFDPGPGPSAMVGDPERLQQVVWNLLSNAVKFTDPPGTIRVELGREASTIVLRIADSGRGIDRDFLPFVFERFKQADSSTTRRFGGLGLGLALVRHIVELHGGVVGVESGGPGKGATFHVTLPVRPVAPPPAPPPAPAVDAEGPPAARPEGALDGARVLVIDDDPDARDLLEAVLRRAGALVETAGSAAAGFDALRRSRPHVIVCDIGMPVEDGNSFLRRVRALDPAEGGAVPSLALTAYTRSEDRAKALASGFTAYLGKPVSPDTLVATVAGLIGDAPGEPTAPSLRRRQRTPPRAARSRAGSARKAQPSLGLGSLGLRLPGEFARAARVAGALPLAGLCGPFPRARAAPAFRRGRRPPARASARPAPVLASPPEMPRRARPAPPPPAARLAPLAACLLLGGCTPKDRHYESVVQLSRRDVVERDDKGNPVSIDVELEWDPCPGDQFQTIRGGPEFTACMAKYEVGDMLPVVVRHFWSTRGFYRWSVLKLGDCDRPPERGDTTSFEKIQECSDVKSYGVNVGFQCSRKPYADLIKICPWMRHE